MYHHQARHRGREPFDPLTELAVMTRDHTVSTRHGAPDAENPQYVVTAHAHDDHSGQVLMVLSPAAAGVLSQIVARFASTHPSSGVGLEDYDPSLWHHVALDLVRNRALAAGRIDATAEAGLYGGTRPTPLAVVQ